MAATAPPARDQFTADLGAALQTATRATRGRTRLARSKIFDTWRDFCDELNCPCTLRHCATQEQALAYLLVFGIRYRRSGQTGKSVRSGTVGKALHAVGEGIADLGGRDPRYSEGTTKLDPVLASFLKSLKDDDDPATRAYPVNLTIIRALTDALDTEDPEFGALNQHVIDLIIVGFY